MIMMYTAMSLIATHLATSRHNLLHQHNFTKGKWKGVDEVYSIVEQHIVPFWLQFSHSQSWASTLFSGEKVKVQILGGWTTYVAPLPSTRLKLDMYVQSDTEHTEVATDDLTVSKCSFIEIYNLSFSWICVCNLHILRKKNINSW